MVDAFVQIWAKIGRGKIFKYGGCCIVVAFSSKSNKPSQPQVNWTMPEPQNQVPPNLQIFCLHPTCEDINPLFHALLRLDWITLPSRFYRWRKIVAMKFMQFCSYFQILKSDDHQTISPLTREEIIFVSLRLIPSHRMPRGLWPISRIVFGILLVWTFWWSKVPLTCCLLIYLLMTLQRPLCSSSCRSGNGQNAQSDDSCNKLKFHGCAPSQPTDVTPIIRP